MQENAGAHRAERIDDNELRAVRETMQVEFLRLRRLKEAAVAMESAAKVARRAPRVAAILAVLVAVLVLGSIAAYRWIAAYFR
jgi:hypothetical protein